MSAPVSIAVLDDYQELSPPHFQLLDPSRFFVTYFNDTLLPYDHPSTVQAAQDELVARLKPFTIISTMRERTPFPAELLAQLPNLKLLLTTGMLNRAINLGAAQSLGIRVVGAPGEGRSGQPSNMASTGPDSTTQHCVALILGIARNLAADDLAVKTGAWQKNINTALSGKTLGLVGLGRLGTAVGKIMHGAFGMRVIAWSSNLTQESADEHAKAAGFPAGTFEAVSKDALFKTADVVSLHYVLSDRSRGIVGKEDLEMMKRSALFVNTSRGPLVDEKVLLRFLKGGQIKGAALDVYEIEPLPTDSEWRTTKWGVDGRSHVLLTPHMGYVEREPLDRWYQEAVENIERWDKGENLLHILT
ncbi:MAG: hypothetical protein M1818_002152 [Claussenomyces sp. TS43310]|nr:MAG: hypothetical protein M1818_002152 [Claussenomyces sp. TS43310]